MEDKAVKTPPPHPLSDSRCLPLHSFLLPVSFLLLPKISCYVHLLAGEIVPLRHYLAAHAAATRQQAPRHGWAQRPPTRFPTINSPQNLELTHTFTPAKPQPKADHQRLHEHCSHRCCVVEQGWHRSHCESRGDTCPSRKGNEISRQKTQQFCYSQNGPQLLNERCSRWGSPHPPADTNAKIPRAGSSEKRGCRAQKDTHQLERHPCTVERRDGKMEKFIHQALSNTNGKHSQARSHNSSHKSHNLHKYQSPTKAQHALSHSAKRN